MTEPRRWPVWPAAAAIAADVAGEATRWAPGGWRGEWITHVEQGQIVRPIRLVHHVHVWDEAVGWDVDAWVLWLGARVPEGWWGAVHVEFAPPAVVVRLVSTHRFERAAARRGAPPRQCLRGKRR